MNRTTILVRACNKITDPFSLGLLRQLFVSRPLVCASGKRFVLLPQSATKSTARKFGSFILLQALMPFFFLFAVGCKDNKSYKNYTLRTSPMSATSAEARVPSGLWDILEGLYTPLQAFGNAAVNEKRENLKSRVDIPMKFMPFKVFLIEKTRGVLGGEHHELIFGDGGGILDFRDFLTEKDGNFIFAIELKNEILKDQIPHVYFVSNAKRRKIDGTIFGGGCESYVEITEYFNNVMKHDGIPITTLDSRHLLLLAGTFFFGAYVDDKLLLAQLTIKDSRYKSSHCRGI